MWKLDRIQAENLCAFRRLDYALTQGVTTLVFGDNRDNDSQRSNGSGKSALIEAIAVGITGSPLRKVRGEEIINDAAEECSVNLRFSNNASDEVFTVCRHIPRKGASTVECRIFRGGNAEESTVSVQPSVDAYNRFILEKLGVTREELFNSYILSKYKYQDFLSASDTQKKEIINRFSGGCIVDQAIDKIAEDIAPVEKKLQQANLEMAAIDGRVDMLSEQIVREEQAVEEKVRTRTERIAAMEETIAEKRSQIREQNGRIAALGERIAALEEAEKILQSLEEDDAPVDVCLEKVRGLFAGLDLKELTDWDEVLTRKRHSIAQAASALTLSKADWSDVTISLKELMGDCDRLKERYSLMKAENEAQSREYEERIQKIGIEMAEAVAIGDGMRRKRRDLLAEIETLRAKLSGTITCPACRHEFLLADETFDIGAAREALAGKAQQLQDVEAGEISCRHQGETIEKEQDKLRQCKRELMNRTNAAADELTRSESAVRSATERLHKAELRQKSIESDIAALQAEMDSIRRKLFDEAFCTVDDACRRAERSQEQLHEEIRSAQSAIATLCETISEMKTSSVSDVIASLKKSLKEYRLKSSEALRDKEAIEKELHRMREQQQYFVLFKSYLANTKIEALNRITNEFLENIGSDIRIRLSGFTALKTGKIREKISATLIRDGVDCGSFGKFSAGEAARVHLSTILAMQRLVNSGCEEDKGLSLLVLDEILDAMDESGLSHTFGTLNRLGITALVVSHGNVAEGYEHKLVIVKENGESRIE